MFVCLWLIPFQFTYKSNVKGRWILKATASIKGLKYTAHRLTYLCLQQLQYLHCILMDDIHLTSCILIIIRRDLTIAMTGSSIGHYIPSIALPMALYSNNIDATKVDMTKALQRNSKLDYFLEVPEKSKSVTQKAKNYHCPT